MSAGHSANTEDPAKQCYKWQKSNMNMRSWNMELKEELCNIGLAFVCRKQQKCNLREITKIVTDVMILKREYFSKILGENSLTLYQEINFPCSKKTFVEWCSRKERNEIGWPLAEVWQLKGMRRNTSTGR